MNQLDKILIVDDEENICRYLARTLTEAGYICETVSDGRQGLEALNRDSFAVALVDLQMPRMDGMALLSALAATTIDTVPVILTGNGDVSRAVEAMKLGAYDFIEKPCGERVLCSVVQRAGKHHRMLRHARSLAVILDRWETVFDAWPDIIVILDTDQRIILCNRSVTRQLGVSKKELIGRHCHEALCFDAHPPDRCPFAGIPPDQETGSFEFFHLRWGIHYELTSAPLKDRLDCPWGSLYIARDISRRKQAEEKLLAYHEQLHALGCELALTEARERQRIAVDLHDGIGQTLAMVKLRLDVLRGSLAASTSVADEFSAIGALIEQTIHSTRTMTFELSPPVLYEVGLEAAVAALLEQIQGDHGILTSFEDDGLSLLLDRNTRVILFQAVRELLVNAVKHAEASELSVTIQKTDNRIRIMVEDNGIGFDSARFHGQPGQGGGLGLFIIRERFDHLHIEFQIDSAPGAGTRITISTPATNAIGKLRG